MARPFPRWRGVMASDERLDLPVIVYALVDPRDQTVRYVGQTRNLVRRRHGHWEGTASAGLRRWREELRAAGEQFRLWTIVRVAEDMADAAERYWISFYRALGNLYNVEDGGIKSGWGNCIRCGLVLRCRRCKRASQQEERKKPQTSDNWGWSADVE